jgi:glycine/D-amino acid oxidase-like deaminating enzyme
VTARGPAPEVAIVGGGIVGTALAAELAGRGVGVALYERRKVAAGASGRNSGAVWYPADPVLGALYLETLERYRRLADEVRSELPASVPERGFRLADEPAGILTLGWADAALRAQATGIAAASPAFRATFVGQDDLRRLEPGLADGLAAVRLDIGFPVAPAAACRTFAALAVSRGARIHEGVAARVLRDARAGVGLATDGGVVRPGAVVVAAGPWSPEAVDLSGAWRPILPYWGVIVELGLDRPPTHVLEEADIDTAIEPDGGLAEAEDGATGFSLVTAGGRSSLGSTFLPFEPDPRDYERRLREGGARYVPAIATSPTRGLRACARPLALDGRPLVGPVPGIAGVFIAAGHGPWGISTGPASAAHVAALVLGEPDPREPAVRSATDAGRFGAPPA